MDNFATGHRHNLTAFSDNQNFRLIEGDIRNMEDCQKAVVGVDYILHQATLGSVLRSINLCCGHPEICNAIHGL